MNTPRNMSMNTRGLVEDWTWLLLWIPLTVIVAALIYPLATDHLSTTYQTKELERAIITRMIQNQLSLCDAVTQRCDPTRIQENAFALVKILLSSPKRLAGIELITTNQDLQKKCKDNAVLCQYNSDEQDRPDCATKRKGSWCAYQQLKPVARVKGISIHTTKLVWNDKTSKEETITIDGVVAE